MAYVKIKEGGIGLSGVVEDIYYEAPVDSSGRAALAFLLPSGKVVPHPFRRVVIPDHLDEHGNLVLASEGPEPLRVSDQEWIFSPAKLQEALTKHPDRVVMVNGGIRQNRDSTYDPDAMKAAALKEMGGGAKAAPAPGA
jgi:hypothetical protein